MLVEGQIQSVNQFHLIFFFLHCLSLFLIYDKNYLIVSEIYGVIDA